MATVTISNHKGKLANTDTSSGDDSILIEDSTITGRFSTKGGSDSLIVNNSSIEQPVSLGSEADTFNSNNSTLSQGVLLEGGNDTLSVDHVTVRGRIDGGAGDNEFTLSNTNSKSWINLTTSANSSVTLLLTDSSVTGVRATNVVNKIETSRTIAHYDIEAHNSTISSGIRVDSSLGGNLHLSGVSIAPGYGSASGIQNVNSSVTAVDIVSIESSTISGAINLNEGADTLIIKDTTLTSSGNVINIDDTKNDGQGDLVSLSHVDMSSGNININSGAYDYSLIIDDSTVRALVDQGGHTKDGTILITNSTLEYIQLDESRLDQNIEIIDSSLGDSGSAHRIMLNSGDDTVHLKNTTVDFSHSSGQYISLQGGDDLLEVGKGTRFLGATDGDVLDGAAQNSGGDTLGLTGSPWTITLQTDVTLNDGSVTNVITDKNFDDIKSGPKSDGDVSRYDGTLAFGDASNTIRVEGWEALSSMPCYGRGTLINAAKGQVAIEDLRVGDLVFTADAGLQPVRWVGSRKLSFLDMLTSPRLIPIRISKGALGAGLPERDLILSQQHRVLARGNVVERMFDAHEVLVAAKHLTALSGINLARDMQNVEYFHLMFDEHQIIFADGVASESLYSGPEALNSIDDEARAEIFAIFPDLAEPFSAEPAKPARVLIPGRAARKLAERLQRNGHDLCPVVMPDAYSEADTDRELEVV